jgi:hypothetical protein
VGFAMLCTIMLVSGFGSINASDGPKKAKPKATTTTKAPVTTTTAPPTTTSTTTTTTTVPPVTIPNAVPPSTTTTTTTSTTTTTLPMPEISASVSNTPTFCIVTLALSTGPTQQYPLDAFVKNVGDVYVFVAAFAGYRVDVRAEVVNQNNAPVCQISLAHLERL